MQQINYWLKLKTMLRYLIKRGEDAQVTQIASSLSFQTLLSLVPLATVAFALLTAFPLFEQLRQIIQDFMMRNVFPVQISKTVVDYLNLFAAKARGLTLAGTLFLLISAAVMMLTIDQAINKIYKVRCMRALTQRLLIHWAAITLGPVMLGIIIYTTSSLITHSLGMMGDTTNTKNWFNNVMPIGLSILGLTSLYVIVPNRNIPWRHGLVGGICTALVFEVLRRLFAWYITNVANYTALYGTLAVLPAFLLWIYLSWLILLYGAILTASINTYHFEREQKTDQAGERFIYATLILRLLYQARHINTPGMTLQNLSSQLRADRNLIENLLFDLQKEAWVGLVQVQTDDETWVLTCDPEQITLNHLINCMSLNQAYTKSTLNALAPELTNVFNQIFNQTISEKNLTQLFQKTAKNEFNLNSKK